MENKIVLGIILVVLFLPSSSKTQDVKTWKDTIDKYELLSNEGFVALKANAELAQATPDKEETKPVAPVVPVKCDGCGGTGVIKTGDGRTLDCPKCGTNNSGAINVTMQEEDSQKKSIPIQPELYTEPEEIDYIPSLEGRLILFTNPEWCGPCRLLESTTLLELKKANYTTGSLKEKVHITILDENYPFFKKYCKDGTIPHFVFIHKGKVVRELTGYQSYQTISELINWNLKNE